MLRLGLEASEADFVVKDFVEEATVAIVCMDPEEVLATMVDAAMDTAEDPHQTHHLALEVAVVLVAVVGDTSVNVAQLGAIGNR